MDAESFRIAKVFSGGGDIHFRLPYFQREYAWEQQNWKTLLDDILDLYDIYKEENPPEHFMGSLVVINEGMVHGTVPVFKLVDGQQRLTTITLILCAIAEIIKTSHPEMYNKIRKYITNPDEPGEHRYKLLPTSKYGDRKTYLSIIDGKVSEIVPNGSRIIPAYQYYYKELSVKLNSGELEVERLFHVIINSLQVVFISLNREEKPYQIFESLNAKGKPLTQADLVRNYIAMKLPEARQPEIFENHWSKIEELLQEKRSVGRSRLGELTAFLRHYLAFRNAVLGNEEHVYARFRDRIEENFNTTDLFEQEVKTLQQFADYYDRFLRPEHESDPEVRRALHRLNLLEISTGYPFMLALFDAYNNHTINKSQFLESLRILENYLVRRFLAGEPTNYLNKVFPTLWKKIDKNNFIPSLKEVIINHNYPADYAVLQKGLSTKLYGNSSITRSKTALVLDSINIHLSEIKNQGGHTVLNGPATIEHILPQNPSEQWITDIGDNFNNISSQYLHTLGNLTLVTTEWNSALSNLPFSDKKPKLANHALLLNQEYFARPITCWNENAIQARAQFLLKNILEIWPAIGEMPAPKKASGTKPFKLILLDQEFEVSSWRDVAIKTTEAIAELVGSFDEYESLPSYLSKKPFVGTCRQLSNGWYLYVSLSANAIKYYCRSLMTKVGFDQNEWQVEEH
ncbi:MAG: DUF262 domain-containing protein [Chloroflexi bacterium]|jgi:uncharacterized protein with ParB-like and HNH nuclease domain|nr:DUF262 domain-containing protein [Chloroflexota bacterium]